MGAEEILEQIKKNNHHGNFYEVLRTEISAIILVGSTLIMLALRTLTAVFPIFSRPRTHTQDLHILYMFIV